MRALIVVVIFFLSSNFVFSAEETIINSSESTQINKQVQPSSDSRFALALDPILLESRCDFLDERIKKMKNEIESSSQKLISRQPPSKEASREKSNISLNEKLVEDSLDLIDKKNKKQGYEVSAHSSSELEVKVSYNYLENIALELIGGWFTPESKYYKSINNPDKEAYGLKGAIKIRF